MIKIVEADILGNDFFDREASTDVSSKVCDILESVKQDGDAALQKYTNLFDKVAVENFKVNEDTLSHAIDDVKKEHPKLVDALRYSIGNVKKFAQKQRECFSDFEMEIEPGIFAAQKNIAIERAGVYIPAGRYPLLSTAIMNVVPAIVAGVKNITVCTPPQKSSDGFFCNKLILAAIYLCTAGEKVECNIFTVGGAQAVGAMAFGTKSIHKVDVITGPGNAFVAEAKKQVYGKVGIDMIAGPTEVLVMSDGNVSAKFVAADLLSQAEHDKAASAVLLTTNRKFAESVSKEIDVQLAALGTKEVASESISNNGLIVICCDLQKMASIANQKAPEHLEIASRDAKFVEEARALVHNYGSLFIGEECAEVFGDYVAGVNHTLPTMGAARYTGGLSVRTFLKTVTQLYSKGDAVDMHNLSCNAAEMAQYEGLLAHKNAALIRLQK